MRRRPSTLPRPRRTGPERRPSPAHPRRARHPTTRIDHRLALRRPTRAPTRPARQRPMAPSQSATTAAQRLRRSGEETKNSTCSATLVDYTSSYTRVSGVCGCTSAQGSADSFSLAVPRPRMLKQRRAERVAKQAAAANGGDGSGINVSSPGGSDEWIGRNAGATCANCGTSTTPLWRKDPEGRIICNACGE